MTALDPAECEGEVRTAGYCPRCRTSLDFTERCPSEWGLGRCMANTGHDGWHWSDMGYGDGSILRWTGVYSVRSCSGRLNLMVWCQKPAGHNGAHNDGRGTTFMGGVFNIDTRTG